MLKCVGKGSFGEVYECIDNESGAKVAVKKMQGVFISSVKWRFASLLSSLSIVLFIALQVDAKRSLRELSILRQCNHPCIINILDVIQPRTSLEFLKNIR